MAMEWATGSKPIKKIALAQFLPIEARQPKEIWCRLHVPGGTIPFASLSSA
jgi:hypothetical protein